MLSFLVLIALAVVGLFFYHRRSSLFQLLPLGLLFGAGFLLLGRYSDTIFDATNEWRIIPGLLINVVFATLFFGKKIMKLSKIWKFAGPQIVFGQTLAWGQYVVGTALAGLVLVPVFAVSALSGALIEISFEGGHGTAAGLAGLFEDLNFAEGADIALGLATVGIVAGIASGLVMTAIYKKVSTHDVTQKKTVHKKPIHTMFGEFIVDTQTAFFSRHTILRTMFQLILVAGAIVLGMGLKEALLMVETGLQMLVNVPDVVRYIPLFPLAMIGGICIQLVAQLAGMQKLIHAKTMAFIGSVALEIVIITAIATMSLAVISDNLAPFVLLALTGFMWNIFAFLVLAPRMIHSRWFERGIGDFGQSMGMTATGLLLMRSADPANKSQAMERFGYKQLLFEPIVGGGIFTAMSMILIFEFGLLAVFILSCIVMLFWLILGIKQFGFHYGDNKKP